MIYSANPNPFIDNIEINYGVFTKSKVIISVFNIHGEIVRLFLKSIRSWKIFCFMESHDNLPKGHYFISILINQLQVHYVKVIRQ